MLTLGAPQKFQYIECNKGGFHKGQLLTMVCLEPSCLNEAPCCCVCIQQAHSKHTTISIKKMIFNVHAKLQKASGIEKKQEINTQAVKQILDGSKKQAFDKFIEYKNNVRDKIVTLENKLQNYYGNMSSQLSKEGKNDFNAAMEVLNGSYTNQELNLWMKKLVLHQIAKQDQEPATEENVRDNIQNQHKEIMSSIIQKVNKFGTQLQQILNKTNKNMNQINIWKPKTKYKFTPQWKAQKIQIVDQYTVKSTTSNCYRFAVMSPDIERGGDFKQFKFRLKYYQSSWVAVGMCHRDIVKGNNYQFPYSYTGHGAYMVSSNAGSWSNKQDSKNNKVLAFNFYQGDTITVQVNFSTKKIKFIQNDHDNSYEIQFETIKDKKLYPCALFYFNNDIIQYLQKDAENLQNQEHSFVSNSSSNY